MSLFLRLFCCERSSKNTLFNLLASLKNYIGMYIILNIAIEEDDKEKGLDTLR